MVWEAFKVYDGQIHAVEAFMKVMPVDRPGRAGTPMFAARFTRHLLKPCSGEMKQGSPPALEAVLGAAA